jgi:signal transduction histidine kinase
VSHDLRAPLVAMRGCLELLATKGETLAADQRQQCLGIAVRQSVHSDAAAGTCFTFRLPMHGSRR